MSARMMTTIGTRRPRVIPTCLAQVTLSLVAIVGWGTGATAQSLAGAYGGRNCGAKFTFSGKDVVYIQALDEHGSAMSEVPGQYKVDGDKVSVTSPNGGVVFTRKGNALETPSMGKTIVCTKLTDVELARIAAKCDEFNLDYNKGNVCFDIGPVPDNPQSATVHAGRATLVEPVTPSEIRNPRRVSSINGASALPTPADASVVPEPALVLISVSPTGHTDSAKVSSASNVAVFTAVALEVAKQMRWRPAQKHGEAVGAWVYWEFQPVAPEAGGFISVTLTGERARASVRIDGVNAGLAPLVDFKVRPGRHTIQVEAGGMTQFVGQPARLHGSVADTVQVDVGSHVKKSYATTQMQP